jgi:hypothetical protein
VTPSPLAASIAMKTRPSGPATGAPASASAPVAAQAPTSGASRSSPRLTGEASSSYPVSDSSGKTTSRAPAARTAVACAAAFAAT